MNIEIFDTRIKQKTVDCLTIAQYQKTVCDKGDK